MMVEAQVEEKRVRVGWTVLRMCAIVAVAVLFNFFPDKVGTIRSALDSRTFTPVLSPGFRSVLPLANLWLGLAFSLHLAQLVLGRRTAATQWLGLLLHLFGAGVLGWMTLVAESILLPRAAASGQRLLAVLAAVALFGVVTRIAGLFRLKPIIIQWEQG
jgi:hypothetical protein